MDQEKSSIHPSVKVVRFPPTLFQIPVCLHTFYSNVAFRGGYGYFMESHKIDGGRLYPSHESAKGHKILKETILHLSILHGKTNIYMHRWSKFEI